MKEHISSNSNFRQNSSDLPEYDDNYHRRVAELYAMLEGISDAVYIGNAEGITLANQAALDQLGFTSREELNRGIGTLAAEINTRDAKTGVTIPPEKQAFARALGGERVIQDVMVRHRLTGEELIVRCAASPVILDGKVIAAVAINTDVTEQRKAEITLRENQERQTFLLTLSDALRPLLDPVAIQEKTTQLLGEHLNVDRTYYAWTDEARQVAIIERDYIRDGSMSLAGQHRLADFLSIMNSIDSGKVFIANDVMEMPEVQPQLENYLAIGLRALVCTPLIKDGHMVAAMAITNSTPRRWTRNEILLLEETAERTWAAVERARAEIALRDSELQFQTFVATSSDVIYRMSPDWKVMQDLKSKEFLMKTDHPTDTWLEVYLPKEEQARVKEAINEAIREKKMFELEHRVIQADGSIGWTFSRAVPLLDKRGNIREWLGAASDITFRKRAEEQLMHFNARLEQEVNERTSQLKESRDQLQSIFDISLMQMTVLKAVRNENGRVMDMEIKMINKEHERVMGRTDLVGKYYVQEYPGMKKSVLFNLIVKTIETGEPQQAEYYYPYEGFNRWYSCMFVKFNDGVVSVNMDISARKQAEEERFKNYLLLQQSEDLALLGSWDFDLSTGAFTWSDGMYRLFNLEKGTGVTPEIYLRYTTATGRPAAERVVRHLKEGDTDFAETLELNIAGQIKIMHLKATVVRNNNSEPVRVLGVDKDITASRRADEKIRRMEAEQQQEIFRVTLASQEEERRRISESLHNGLGQLLYAIKISMTRLTPEQAADESQAYIQAKKYTDELLKDAIVESRRISHELMPSILEDFGLKAAIEDVCSQLSINVKFNCIVTGFVGRLDSYMELAIFRTMQELMLNVVKHSGATEAAAEASINTDEVLIKVQDNGRGMLNSGERKAGIGLNCLMVR